MTPIRLRSTLAFLLLLALLASACTPLRRGGRGDGGGGGDDDDAAGDDDDAVGDDDDAGGTLYVGSVYGGLKGSDFGAECSGTAEVRIDDEGWVTSGILRCGDDCLIEFAGPYAFSEESFTPTFDCEIDGYTPEIYEVDAWIYGSAGEYTQGSINGYGEGDYFYVSFDAYSGDGV